jgi:L-threonylcarbamoyladenylate synthase
MAVELTTRVLKADREAIAEGARVLADGGLVAFPTETVYGLGANAFDDKAVCAALRREGTAPLQSADRACA